MSNKKQKVAEAMAKSKKNLKLTETPGSNAAPLSGSADAAVSDVPVPDAPVAEKKGKVAKPKSTDPNALPPLPKAKRSPKKKNPKPCECGCGGNTAGGRFIPGHDSKLKAWCLRIERNLIKYSDIQHEGVREAVRKQMKAGGLAALVGKGKKKAEDADADVDGNE